MDFLIIADKPIDNQDKIFHTLISIAKKLKLKAWFYPIINSEEVVSYEFSIGTFSNVSKDLRIIIPIAGNELGLIINNDQKIYEQSSNDDANIWRIGLIDTNNEELIYRFCQEYIRMMPSHKISYDAQTSNELSSINIDSVKFQDLWYEKINNKSKR